MRFAWTILAVAAAVAMSGCLDDGGQGETGTDQAGPAREAASWAIDIEGSQFVAGSFSVQVGDSIQWTNRDSGDHTVTADRGAFDSGTIPGNMFGLAPDSSYARTFTEPGTYSYHCERHSSMKGTITVLESYAGAP